MDVLVLSRKYQLFIDTGRKQINHFCFRLDEDQYRADMNGAKETERDLRFKSHRRRLERQRLLYEIANCRAQAKRLEFVIQQTAKLHGTKEF